jgi:hypothetical protein
LFPPSGARLFVITGEANKRLLKSFPTLKPYSSQTKTLRAWVKEAWHVAAEYSWLGTAAVCFLGSLGRSGIYNTLAELKSSGGLQTHKTPKL